MFLLFGTSASAVLLTTVAFACNFCGVHAPQEVLKRATRFTLFFIPLFSFGARYAVTCTNCGGTTDLTKEQADNAMAWAAAR